VADPDADDRPRQRRRLTCGGSDKGKSCATPDCGECTNCLDKPKFGGSNIKKQRCSSRGTCKYND